MTLQFRRHDLLSGSHEPKEIPSNLPHLDFFTTLRDPVSPVMSPYVLKLAMSAVTPSTVNLNRAIGRFGAQSIGPIIAHADLVAELRLDFDMVHTIHICGGLANEQAQHLTLSCKFDQRELNCLVGGQWFAEGASSACISDTLLHAVDCCA